MWQIFHCSLLVKKVVDVTPRRHHWLKRLELEGGSQRYNWHRQQPTGRVLGTRQSAFLSRISSKHFTACRTNITWVCMTGSKDCEGLRSPTGTTGSPGTSLAGPPMPPTVLASTTSTTPTTAAPTLLPALVPSTTATTVHHWCTMAEQVFHGRPASTWGAVFPCSSFSLILIKTGK